MKKHTNKRTAANAIQVGGDHYKQMGVEPWDVVDTWPLEQQVGYYRGSALKYTMRMGAKDERLKEAGKGLHYLQKLCEVLAADESTSVPEPASVLPTPRRTKPKGGRRVSRN